ISVSVYFGGGIHGHITRISKSVVGVVVTVDSRIFNRNIASREAMTIVVLIGNSGVDSGKFSTVGAVRSTVLNSESRIFYINLRTVYIAAIGAVNQEGAVAGYFDFSGSG